MVNETTYRALSRAAEAIGQANYKAGLDEHLKAGRKRYTYRYQPTQVHRAVVAAMVDPEITDEQAMALLLVPEVFHERFGRTPW